jgi:radical SAM protein (TIGR01212 family)
MKTQRKKKDQAEPFYSYSRYLRECYGETVYRVSVDAGFSCPHRGADRSNPGCSFCAEDGARAPYLGDTGALEEQIKGAIAFLKKRYGANQFLLYFQAFTNTFAPAAELKRIYDRGLALAEFRELVVSTRPDCIDLEKVKLLRSYKNDRRDVWVELGLQSMHEATLLRIRRDHTVEEFLVAYRLLKEQGLKVCVHLIFGLPGEGMEEISETMKRLGALQPDGVKIHNLHIVRGTRLAEEYERGEVCVPGAALHLEYTIRALEFLPPATVIMRLTTDTPLIRLIAPRFFPPKQRFLKLVKDEMQKRGAYQGKNETCTLTSDTTID